jgi:hypothetical protein
VNIHAQDFLGGGYCFVCCGPGNGAQGLMHARQTLPLSYTPILQVFVRTPVSILDTHVGMELLGQTISFILKNHQMFFCSSGPSDTPTSNTPGFEFLHILANTCYFLFLSLLFLTAILDNMKYCPIGVLVCSSLMEPWCGHLFKNVFFGHLGISIALCLH